MLTLQSNVIGLFLKKSSLLFPHLTLYLAFFLLSGHLFLIPPRHPILFPYPHTSPLPPIVTFLVTVDESESPGDTGLRLRHAPLICMQM